MNTTAIGRRAEVAAASYLQANGYRVIAQNWKNRYCEIDLVVELLNIIYFVEVKYRRSDQYGNGFDYVTKPKLRQMQFAARFWVHTQGWSGDYRLAVIQVEGAEFSVTGCLLDL